MSSPTLDATTVSDAIPPAFRSPLQVSRIQADDSEETVEFIYGKAPAVSFAGSEGTWPYSPTVVREIAFPQRSLQLHWEPQPQFGAPTQAGSDGAAEPRWTFGVEAVFEQGVSTYERVAPIPADNRTWVRQSRHFAFASTPRIVGSCKTFVRDRWILQGNPERPEARRAYDRDSDGDIPTFEWDLQERTLVPVPGEMTRRLDWEPGKQAPDLHRAGYQARATTGGLKGGNPGAGPGAGSVWPTPISIDPTTHEVTMGAIAGGPPPSGPGASPSFVGSTAVDMVSKSLQELQQSTQQSLAAAADLQASVTQQAALAQAAQDARMESIQTQMAAQTQARNEAWFHPMAGAPFSAPIQEPFRANVEAQAQIQGRLHEVSGVQGRANERQAKTAEILKRAAEALRLAREAKKQQAVDGQKRPMPEENISAIEVLRPLSNAMQDKPGDVLILFWDWKEGGVVGEQSSVGHVATAVKDSNGWVIAHSQFPHSPGGKHYPYGPNTTIADPGKLFDAEGHRKPNSAYLVTVPNLGSLANYMIADLEKPLWETNPGSRRNSTNCTYGTIHALRAGGVPLSSMWANQTLIIPLAPYLPRDLRTALKRDAPLNAIHDYKVYHKNELINDIQWEYPNNE